MTAFPIKVEV